MCVGGTGEKEFSRWHRCTELLAVEVALRGGPHGAGLKSATSRRCLLACFTPDEVQVVEDAYIITHVPYLFTSVAAWRTPQ